MGTLNSHLQPSDAPVSQNMGAQSAYDFFAKNERSAVTLPRIKNFSFSQAVGGTLTLGGPDNGNGYFVIKNDVGDTIVEGNNLGLTVYDGNIVIKNADDTTIIDTNGIVSTANFPNDIVVNSTGYTTTGTTLTDVPGSSLSFTLARDTKVLINLGIQARNTSYVANGSFSEVHCIDSLDGDIMSIDMTTNYYITGFSYDGGGFIDGITYSHDYQFSTLFGIFELSAGAHTIKLQHRVDGSGTSEIGTYILSYIILGS